MARVSSDKASVSPDDTSDFELSRLETSAEATAIPAPSSRAPTSSGDEALITSLIRELVDSWRRGECRPAEAYLARLRERPGREHGRDEAEIRLISEEIRLRLELGYGATTAEYVRRFPDCESQLGSLFDLAIASSRTRTACEGSSALPAPGESIGEFRLRAPLGSGAQGCVFLASQPGLANRSVVLKITPCDGQEHLTLARLQHAHIVPLYSAQDFDDQGLRVLCMPDLGGESLQGLLEMIGAVPPWRRSGRDLLNALDWVQARTRADPDVAGKGGAPSTATTQGPARRLLSQATYVQAVCWIGACLADALHFAHQRDLLHLDLKPSNILLAADGTPMLLDFHLARTPIRPGAPGPRQLGGTPVYMSPEQRAAMSELRAGRAVTIEIDGRSDIFSLGRTLYEALGGEVGSVGWIPVPRRGEVGCAPPITPGLRDILAHCLEANPRDRYPDAARLAEDLRRHMADLPLRGVPNRSWSERWRKWRRRRPHALGRIVTSVVAASAILLAGLFVVGDLRQRQRRAEAALAEGTKALAQEVPDDRAATRALERGLALFDPSQAPIPALGRLLLPVSADLRRSLGEQLRLARNVRTAAELHDLVDRLRLLSGSDPAETGPLRALERRLGAAWESRGRHLDRLGGDLSPSDSRRLRVDLLELGIFWANLRVRMSAATDPPAEVERTRRDALRVLEEAEALFGPRSVLERERQSYAEALGLTDLARLAARRRTAMPPGTAWEHYALGRSLLEAGDFEAAEREFAGAVDLEPHDLWFHFCRGVCAYRLRRYDAAVSAFEVCIALASDASGRVYNRAQAAAECYYNRGRAHAALGRPDLAIRDYGHALRHAPDLAIAAINRGVLFHREGRYPEAIADFRRALPGSPRPATVHYNLALAHDALGELDAARASLQAALRLEPDQADFRALHRRLHGERPDR